MNNSAGVIIIFIILLLLFVYLFLTAFGLTPGDSSTAHIYTQTVHRIHRTEHTQQ
jgi:hypothetical protein